VHISVVSLYVDDVDRAIDFYTNKLGWQKTMDAPMGEGARWVTVAPAADQTAFTLALAGSGMAQDKKAGGFSGVIIETDDVFAASDRLKKLGIEITDGPRNEPWGGWASFKDSEGNEHGLHSPVAAGVSAN